VKRKLARAPRQTRSQSTRESLLQAAIEVFAQSGLHGGSVSRIAELAGSHDRMIYYYFGNKEGLFIAALEEIYRRYNAAEAEVHLDADDPIRALEQVVVFFVRYFRDHPEFVTLLNSENLHRGKHISQSLRANEYSRPAIGRVDPVLTAGQKAGLFKPELSSRDVYVMISAMGYFYQSNRYTLSAFLGLNLAQKETYDEWERFVIRAVLSTVRVEQN
jgi:TetR/AcrR family transcriptional regulator, upper aerobic nicotinate degradation pathway regulator